MTAIATKATSIRPPATRDGLAIWWTGRAKEAGFDSTQALSEALELPRYRLSQIYRAATKELVTSFDSMTALPIALRRILNEKAKLSSLRLVNEATSGDKQTTKLLYALPDGNEVEAVLMRHRGGRTTACISSQAGCARINQRVYSIWLKLHRREVSHRTLAPGTVTPPSAGVELPTP